MKVKGVIFDADGVILDSTGIWSVIGSKFLDSLKITHDKNIDEFLRTMTMPQAILYLKNEFRINLSECEIKDKIREIINKYYDCHVKLKSGVLDFLKMLKEYNVKTCVATANNYDTIKNTFDRLGIKKYFLEIFSCEKMDCDKTSSKIFDMALDFLDLKKNDVVVFEDSLHAIQTVKKANFFVIGMFDKCEQENWGEIKNLANYCFNDFVSAKEFFLANKFI